MPLALSEHGSDNTKLSPVRETGSAGVTCRGVRALGTDLGGERATLDRAAGLIGPTHFLKAQRAFGGQGDVLRHTQP